MMPARIADNSKSGLRYSHMSPLELVRLMQTRRKLKVAFRRITTVLANDGIDDKEYNLIRNPSIPLGG